MNDARRTALIAIDWGTTSARGYRIDARGEILAARSTPLGIAAVGDGDFAAALATLLGGWTADAAPRIACGMIGSRQGWVEAPYVECPADFADLARALARTPGGELAIVPGARCRDPAGVPDVMRGEETQLAGALDPAQSAMLAVLPGTHSKWACVERGRLVDFATFMTGELYAILLEHSIIGRMATKPAANDATGGAAFAGGVARGLAAEGLSHALFGARTLALAGELGEGDVAGWLSGLLIGHEIRAARNWVAAHRGAARPVRVIGDARIGARYLAALAQAGIAAERGPEDAAARGMFRIAQRAGIVH